MGPFKPAVREGYEYASKIIDPSTKWIAVYLLCTKDQALASLQLFVTSTAIPFGSRIFTWRANKSGEYTGEDFKAYCQEASITQQFAATSTPQQIGVSERVGRILYATVRCMRIDSGLPPFLWRELMMATSYICNRILPSALNMETPYKKLHGKDADLSHLKIIGAKTFVQIKNPNKLGHTSWEGMVCDFSETESNSCHSGTQKRVAWWREGTSFLSKYHQICLAATRSRVTVVRFQRRYARRQLCLARCHAAGRAGLHLYSGFRRLHVCRKNGRIASTSTSLTRPTFAWGSLACGNLRPGELHRREHHLHQRPGLHQGQRLHLLLRHQGQLTNTPSAVPWESRQPLCAAEP